jgi:hypothetical protein
LYDKGSEDGVDIKKIDLPNLRSIYCLPRKPNAPTLIPYMNTDMCTPRSKFFKPSVSVGPKFVTIFSDETADTNANNNTRNGKSTNAYLLEYAV